MKKRFLGLLLIASGTMALSACSLLDGLSDLIPSENGNGSSNGQSNYTCPSCNESFNYQPDHEGPCEYEAETCKLCQRDIMLDYIEDFQNHGTQSDPIILESEQELISLNNYVHLNRVEKYFKCNYDIENFTTMQSYISNMYSKSTDASCLRKYSPGSNATKTGSIENTDEQFLIDYKKEAGVDYTDLCLEEYENAIDELTLNKGDRSNTFNDFPIYSRKYELNVRTGDDLFYACTHGYKPNPASGSDAERILNDIKGILRANISDSMNDFEKAFTMYCWLIKNVQYDHGAVQATDYGEFKKRNTELLAWGIEGTIYQHKSICDSLSKTYAVFMGMENIKCIQASGNSHAWNKIYLNLDGEFKWYVVDPTWGNAEGDDGEAANHDEFLYSDAIKTAKHFTADNYKDVVAGQDINQYKYIKYDGTHDLFIENDLELRNYFSYISDTVKQLHSDGKKVMIEVAYPNGALGYEPNNTILKACFLQYFDWDMGSTLSFGYSDFNGYTVYNYKYEA